MPLSAAELRARIKRLGISQSEAAERLGLSANGLYKQLHGERTVSRQTEIILDLIEEVQRLRDNQRQADRAAVAGRAAAGPVSLPDCAAAEMTSFCQFVDHWGWHGLIVRPGSSLTFVPQV